jgi:hypothetical protein
LCPREEGVVGGQLIPWPDVAHAPGYDGVVNDCVLVRRLFSTRTPNSPVAQAIPAKSSCSFRHKAGRDLPAPGARADGRSRARSPEAVLTLRALISNGDFEEHWRFHLAREHQRLYPGTVQGQYTLGALTGQLTPNELRPFHFAGGPGAIPVPRLGPAQR